MQSFDSHHKTRKGFSAPELIILMTIIAILVAFSIPRLLETSGEEETHSVETQTLQSNDATQEAKKTAKL